MTVSVFSVNQFYVIILSPNFLITDWSLMMFFVDQDVQERLLGIRRFFIKLLLANFVNFWYSVSGKVYI